MADHVRETLNTADMAKGLGVSEKLLLRLRRQTSSPFKLGVHYRFQGITTAAPVRWFPKETDEAFSTFQRLDPASIETMGMEVTQ
jgi:hypothetical protein